MIFVKNRLIFGIISRIIKGVFKVIYAILSLVHLQITLLLALVGLVLHFTGVFERNQTVLIIFYLLMIASIVLAIILTILKLLGLTGKRTKKEGKKRRKPDIVENDVENEPTVQKETYEPPVTETKSAYPKYYTVKQNANYVMAEYEDRYELYLKDDGGLKKIRTDYK